MLVSAHRSMQYILRRDPQWQRPGIDHFQAIRIEIQKDITSLGIGPMHQCVDQKLAHHHLVKGRNMLAV